METLQIIWFALIVVLLTGYAILDGFDLGVGIWHLFAKEENERRVMIKSIGPFWDGNEVWLLTGGGAIFAAFSPVYATTFSGFYLAIILVLMGLIFRAVALEVRMKEDGPRWRAFWDGAFSVGSILPALLFGVALGNVLRGIPLDMQGNYTGGFFALLNPYSLVMGLTGLMVFATHGALFVAMKAPEQLAAKARAWASKSWLLAVILFVVTVAWTLMAEYIYSSLILPLSFAFLVFVSYLLAKAYSNKREDVKAFLASSLAILFAMGSYASALFPNMVPNSADMGRSLTVFNASSSQTTLTVMLVLALVGMPIVIGYTAFIYKTFAGRVQAHD